MKWIRYPVRFSERQDIQLLKSRHGPGGYNVLMRALELMSQHIKAELPELFIFDKRYFFTYCFELCCQRTGIKILHTIQELGIWIFSINEDKIEIECKLIVGLADRYLRAKLKGKYNIEDR